MGADNRPFRVLKFRTMVKDAEAQKHEVAHLNMHNGSDSRMFKVPDDPRVTRVGRVLRRWRSTSCHSCSTSSEVGCRWSARVL